MTRYALTLLLACIMQVCQAQPPGGLSLRTNLLFDAAVIPNVGVEWGMGGCWSMNVDAMYIWLSNNRRHRYWRWAVADAELRRWLVGDKYLTEQRRLGWHVGPYAAVYRYDVEFGGEGQRSDFNWGVGGAVGYTWPIGRRWSLDFTLSVGYIDGKYKKYRPEEGDYLWEADYRRRYFGPTKAEVALVWDIWPAGYSAGRASSPKPFRSPSVRKGGYGW